MKTALERAVDAAGGQNELARKLNKSQSVVWGWLRRNVGPVPPAEFCEAIEKASGVPRHELRPDLFGGKRITRHSKRKRGAA